MSRLWVLALMLAGACASTRPDAARERVEDVSQRHLDRDLAWSPMLEPDPEIDAMVARLLDHPLTAETAVQIALVRAPSMQATIEQLGVAQADLVQAGLLRNPHLGGGPRFPPGGRPVAWTFDTAFAFLEVVLIPLRRKLAKARLNQAILHVAYEVLALDAAVREAFYRYVAAVRVFELQYDITETAELAAELASRQLAAGTLSDLEAGLITAWYQELKLELTRAQNDVLEHREQLNRRMGLWGEELRWEARAELPGLPEAELEVDRLEALAVASRLDLQAERVGIEGMVHAVRLARRTPFVAADLGVLGQRDVGGQSTFGPFIELEVPIFDWGRADAARAEAQLRMAQRRVQGLAIDIRSEVRERRNTMLTRRRMVEFQRDVVIEQRRANVGHAQDWYDAMLLGTYELLEIKRAELEAQHALVEHLRDYWIARTRLELAVGGRIDALLTRAEHSKSGNENGD